MVELNEKCCPGCGIIKSISFFHKCKREIDGLQSRCKTCRSDAAKNRYRHNREKILATSKIYRMLNLEKVRCSHREYKRKNSAKIKEYEKANPKMVKAWKTKYINNNRVKHMNAVRKYQKENPDKIRDVVRRRRKYIGDATVEKFSSLEIFERDIWICQICHKQVDRRLEYPDPMSKSLDHIIPIAAGGSHGRKNVQLAHLVCNKIANTRGIRRRWNG